MTLATFLLLMLECLTGKSKAARSLLSPGIACNKIYIFTVAEQAIGRNMQQQQFLKQWTWKCQGTAICNKSILVNPFADHQPALCQLRQWSSSSQRNFHFPASTGHWPSLFSLTAPWLWSKESSLLWSKTGPFPPTNHHLSSCPYSDSWQILSPTCSLWLLWSSFHGKLN